MMQSQEDHAGRLNKFSAFLPLFCRFFAAFLNYKCYQIFVLLDKLTSNINYQGSLFDNLVDDKIDNVIDLIKKKYGSSSITKASLKNNSRIS